MTKASIRSSRRRRIAGKRGAYALKACPNCHAELPAVATRRTGTVELMCDECGYSEPVKNAGLVATLPTASHFKDPEMTARRRRR